MAYEILSEKGNKLLTISNKKYDMLKSRFPLIEKITSNGCIILPKFAKNDVVDMTEALISVIWKIEYTLHTLELVHILGGSINCYIKRRLLMDYVNLIHSYCRGDDVDITEEVFIFNIMEEIMNSKHLDWKILLYIQILILDSKTLYDVPQDLSTEYVMNGGSNVVTFDAGIIYDGIKVNMGDEIEILGIRNGRLYISTTEGGKKYKFLDLEKLRRVKNINMYQLLKQFPYEVTGVGGNNIIFENNDELLYW